MDTLPAEIILTIGRHVCDLKDRLRLLRVCRRWRDLFIGVAYKNVYVKRSQIQSLTKVVLANPRIGSAIRNLSVKWFSVYGDEHPQQSESDDTLPEAVEELVGQISTSPEERRDWTGHLKSGNEEAWLALLLASMPNLTVLTGQYCEDAPRVTQVVAQAARKEPPFDTRPALQRLETLSIVANEDLQDVYPHWQFLPFFHLPSIRDVNLCAVKETRKWHRLDHPAVSSASGTAPVESLVLPYLCNGREGMAELITSCANLRQFKYQHDDEEMPGESYIHFQPRKFYRALLTQKHSLEVLHLSDNGHVEGSWTNDLSVDEDDDGPEAYDRWFGSLAEFSQLQDLRIRVQNLLNYHDRDKQESVVLKDILPPSLRSLFVAHCRTEHCAVLLPNLQGVLAHRKEQFPNLDQICISFVIPWAIYEAQNRSGYPRKDRIPASYKELVLPVAEMCDRAGVKLEMTVDRSRFIAGESSSSSIELESYFH